MSIADRIGRVVFKLTTAFIPKLDQYNKYVHNTRPIPTAIRPGIPAAFFKKPNASSGLVI